MKKPRSGSSFGLSHQTGDSPIGPRCPSIGRHPVPVASFRIENPPAKPAQPPKPCNSFCLFLNYFVLFDVFFLLFFLRGKKQTGSAWVTQPLPFLGAFLAATSQFVARVFDVFPPPRARSRGVAPQSHSPRSRIRPAEFPARRCSPRRRACACWR